MTLSDTSWNADWGEWECTKEDFRKFIDLYNLNLSTMPTVDEIVWCPVVNDEILDQTRERLLGQPVGCNLFGETLVSVAAEMQYVRILKLIRVLSEWCAYRKASKIPFLGRLLRSKIRRNVYERLYRLYAPYHFSIPK
jgi:hypothetical protein